jgi:hypothetical protein
MPPREPDIQEQLLAALRASAAPLAALSWPIPPDEDKGLQADARRLDQLRRLCGMVGRVLVARFKVNPYDAAAAALEAEFGDVDGDLDASQLPDMGLPARARNLALVVADDPFAKAICVALAATEGALKTREGGA